MIVLFVCLHSCLKSPINNSSSSVPVFMSGFCFFRGSWSQRFQRCSVSDVRDVLLIVLLGLISETLLGDLPKTLLNEDMYIQFRMKYNCFLFNLH